MSGNLASVVQIAQSALGEAARLLAETRAMAGAVRAAQTETQAQIGDVAAKGAALDQVTRLLAVQADSIATVTEELSAQAQAVSAQAARVETRANEVDGVVAGAQTTLAQIEAARAPLERLAADLAGAAASAEQIADVAPPASGVVSPLALRGELGRRRRLLDDFRASADIGWSAALARAVAALPAGADLWLRETEYDAPDVTPGLHGLRLRGPGVLKANGYAFRPEPLADTVNTIYVSPAGDDAADGLSPSRPIRTPARAAAILRGYGPVLNGRWRVQFLAAAVYSGADALVDLVALQSARPIYWTGPVVAAGGEPQVVMDGVASTAEFGWRFEQGMFIALHGFRFKGWNKSVQAAGVAAFAQTTLSASECWLDDCNFGMLGKFRAQLTFTGGRATGNQRGVTAFGSCGFTIGWPTTAPANGPLFQDNVYAARFHEGCKGHADNARWFDNAEAIWLQEGSRATIWYGGDFRRNGRNVYSDPTSEVAWDAAVDFHCGDADRGTRHIDLLGGAAYSADGEPLDTRRWRQIELDPESKTATGLAETTIKTRLVKAQRIAAKPHAMRVRVRGYFGGAGTKTLSVRYGGQAGYTFTSFAGAADTFEFEVVMAHSGAPNAASQRWSGRGAEGGSARGVGGVATTVDPTADRALDIVASQSDAAGSTTVTFVEIETNN